MNGALLASVPLLPLLGSVVLMGGAPRLTPRFTAVIACGSVGLAALAVLWLGADFLFNPPPAGQFTAVFGRWFAVPGFEVTAALRLDALSLVLAFVITFVGFFIHLYSSEYMAGEGGYARYFAWLNLFVAAMLLLVLADDLLLLYVGWEGVGLCSYLLIGFWYREPQNGYAARKAFVMTRTGDTLLLIGLLLLALEFDTLRIDAILGQARDHWLPGATTATLVAFLLLGGAVGKSAQLPLHTWLPDAMAGPTPVSALIHAATMVTAGVYLIARLHGLYELAPLAQGAVAVIGAATLLFGGLSALSQADIKRVLAWSTVSQIGYMFLALGLGAWSAALFHLFTHAFFKALLFLAAGAVILAVDHEQEITRMGGLRRRLPLVFWSFVAGGASLASLPLVTAGFFSKELILAAAWREPLLWLAAWAGAVLTAAYVARLIAWVFFTPGDRTIHHRPRRAMSLPLAVLSVGALAAGFLQWPGWALDLHLFTAWLTPLLGSGPEEPPAAAVLLALSAPFLGVVAWWSLRRVGAQPWARRLGTFWREGWRVDALYGALAERPWEGLARRGAGEIADGVFDAIVQLHRWWWAGLSRLQNGLVRRYGVGLVLGAVLLLLANLVTSRPSVPAPGIAPQRGGERAPVPLILVEKPAASDSTTRARTGRVPVEP